MKNTVYPKAYSFSRITAFLLFASLHASAVWADNVGDPKMLTTVRAAGANAWSVRGYQVDGNLCAALLTTNQSNVSRVEAFDLLAQQPLFSVEAPELSAPYMDGSFFTDPTTGRNIAVVTSRLSGTATIVFDSKTGKILQKLSHVRELASTIKINSDTTILAVRLDDGRIGFWDPIADIGGKDIRILELGSQTKIQSGITSFSIAGRGDFVILLANKTDGPNDSWALIVDLKTATVVRELPLVGRVLTGASIIKDSSELFAVFESGIVGKSSNTLRQIIAIKDINHAEVLQPVPVYPAQEHFTFTQDGKSYTLDVGLQGWPSVLSDTFTGVQLDRHQFQGNQFFSAIFASDGRHYLVTRDSLINGLSKMYVYDALTGQKHGEIRLPGNGSRDLTLFKSVGKVYAILSSHDQAEVWVYQLN